MPQAQSRIAIRTQGHFDSINWIEEGDGLIASSRHICAGGVSSREKISEAVNKRSVRAHVATVNQTLLTGLPRASMLLLGYAIEMYLKAGLAKAYFGCAETMFTRDIRQHFGHRYNKLAREIAFKLKATDHQDLYELEKLVLADARYPVQQEHRGSRVQSIDRRNSFIWSTDNYERIFSLAGRIRQRAMQIDTDNINPACHWNYDIDEDGYIACRTGGHLPARITFKVSSRMRSDGEIGPSSVKHLLEQAGVNEILNLWGKAGIYEDGIDSQSCSKTIFHNANSICLLNSARQLPFPAGVNRMSAAE